MSDSMREEIASGSQVTALELFFDLVFVFTITQLATLLAREPTWTGVLQAVLLFGNIWWMYGGYAWMTNAVPPREPGIRLLLLLGMGGFLMVALAIPTAFTGGGLVFGVGYLVVTLVHTAIFFRVSEQSVLRALVGLGPFNLITAVLLLVGGITTGPARVALFAAGLLLHWITPFITRTSGFRIRARHFVERHGLILLIAIGESVVAVGIGLGPIALPPGRVLTALLGLAIAAALWWLYFTGEERRAERAFQASNTAGKPWLALNAFGFAFVPILGGIVAAAAGIKLAVVRFGDPSTVGAALLLAGGIAIYLFGLVLFRIFVRSGRLAIRLLIGIVALATALVGIALSSIAQMAVLSLVLIAGVVIDAIAS